MATLRGIQIDASPDFAANLDLYLNGEKRVEIDMEAKDVSNLRSGH